MKTYEIFSAAESAEIVGSLGFPSKMPGTSYGIPASLCKVGSKLRPIAGSVCSTCYALKGRYGMPGGSIKLAQAKRFASHLCVRVSATMIDGAPSRAFAHTSTVHAREGARGHTCPAPGQGGQCGACRACWSLEVANTSYHVH